MKKSFLAMIIAVSMLALLSGCTDNIGSIEGSTVRFVNGRARMTILTASMEPALPMGSEVIVREAGSNTIEIGDVITFMVNPGVAITHRVIDIIEDYEDTGMWAFQTKGDANAIPDAEMVLAANVVGIVVE